MTTDGELAADWARRGLTDGRGHPYADQLRNLLVDLLIEIGTPEAAVQERRDAFTRRPTAANWQALRKTATNAGADPRPDWAIMLLHERVAEQPAYVTELIACCSPSDATTMRGGSD